MRCFYYVYFHISLVLVPFEIKVRSGHQRVIVMKLQSGAKSLCERIFSYTIKARACEVTCKFYTPQIFLTINKKQELEFFLEK